MLQKAAVLLIIIAVPLLIIACESEEEVIADVQDYLKGQSSWDGRNCFGLISQENIGGWKAEKDGSIWRVTTTRKGDRHSAIHGVNETKEWIVHSDGEPRITASLSASLLGKTVPAWLYC